MRPYLLRKFSNKDAWAEVEASPLWEQGDCPAEALVQVFDNRAGVSTWRVRTEEEVERVIAAQAFMRGTIGDFAYCLIDEDVFRQDGIKLKNTPAKTIDKQVNDLHVDIVDLSAHQLIRLARRINTEFDPLVMTRAEIRVAAAKFFRENKFDRKFLFTAGNKGRSEEEIATAKNLLVNLWKTSDIDLPLFQK
jgi:hypothetical protein